MAAIEVPSNGCEPAEAAAAAAVGGENDGTLSSNGDDCTELSVAAGDMDTVDTEADLPPEFIKSLDSDSEILLPLPEETEDWPNSAMKNSSVSRGSWLSDSEVKWRRARMPPREAAEAAVRAAASLLSGKMISLEPLSISQADDDDDDDDDDNTADELDEDDDDELVETAAAAADGNGNDDEDAAASALRGTRPSNASLLNKLSPPSSSASSFGVCCARTERNAPIIMGDEETESTCKWGVCASAAISAWSVRVCAPDSRKLRNPEKTSGATACRARGVTPRPQCPSERDRRVPAPAGLTERNAAIT